VARGRIDVVHEDGSEQQPGSRDVYIIHLGHYARFVGDDTYVGVDFSSEAERFTKPE
jgi:hypothetical protein